MKKFLIFTVSFALLLMLLQIFSGALITMFYAPDPTLLTGSLPQEVEFGEMSTFSVFGIGIFLTGIFAYFISQQFGKTAKAQVN